MIERGSCVPSSIPRRCDSEPAATFRTTTSSGTISTSRISCSRMLRRRMKQVLRNPVVEDALALDHLVFLGIERGRIILEVLDQGSRLRTFIQDLGLAFINAASTAHWDVPCFVEIHEFGVLRMTRVTTHDGAAVKARNGKQN